MNSGVGTPLRYIADPSGELVDLDDVDQVAEALERSKAQASRHYDFQRVLKEQLWGRTVGEQWTRRLRGTKHELELTAPDEAWDNAALKKAWQTYPILREEVLRVTEIRPNMVAWKKMQATKGGDEYERLKADIKAASKGRVGTPSIKIKQLTESKDEAF